MGNLYMDSWKIGIVERTNRLTLDNSLACHPSNLLSTFLVTGSQFDLIIVPFFKGGLKYLIGRLLIGAPKASDHCNPSSWVRPNPAKADLALFICYLDRFLASSTEPSLKKVVSSAYCSNEIPAGALCLWKTQSMPCENARVVHMVRASTARTKSNSANGLPCLTSLCICIPPVHAHLLRLRKSER